MELRRLLIGLGPFSRDGELLELLFGKEGWPKKAFKRNCDCQ